MFSDRLLNTEQANDEGRKSTHLADGTNLLYLTGGEYRDIFPVWDWTKIPGTTAEQTLDIGERAIGVKGKTSFVGGVSDGTYGLAAMELSRGKLSAHKAWFFFDDEYVCLGAGITSTSANAIATTANQCLQHGEVSRGSNWVHHDSVAYIFPSGAKFEAGAKPQSGKWSEIGAQSKDTVTQNVFTLLIDHGVTPQNSTYEYCVVPGVTPEQTAARASAPDDVQVVSNQPDIQAVTHRALKLSMIAFWKPARIEIAGHSIAVDQPCLLMLRGGKLTVSDPTHKLASLKVTLDSKVFPLDLPAGPMAGSSLTVDVKD
jgi:chondroitin AC lyase